MADSMSELRSYLKGLVIGVVKTTLIALAISGGLLTIVVAVIKMFYPLIKQAV